MIQLDTLMRIAIPFIAIICVGFLLFKWLKFDRYKKRWGNLQPDVKVASSRVIAELITSDGSASMVERKEIEFIPSAVMNQARQHSFDDALEVISKTDEKTKEAIVEIGSWVVKADGYKDPNESAILCSIKAKLQID